MQKIAAYLLERRGNLDTAKEEDRLLLLLREWLATKGVAEPSGEAGNFASKTANGNGRFRWDRASHEECSSTLLRLDELAPNQQTFVTQVSITNDGTSIFVYATLSGGATSSSVAPIFLEPKCPHFIRKMLQLEGSWYHGAYEIGKGMLSQLRGFEDGQGLAAEITTDTRTLPLLVISEHDGQPVFPMLGDDCARDLAGLARVFTVDHQAAWGLTDKVRFRHLAIVLDQWHQHFMPIAVKKHPLTPDGSFKFTTTNE